MKYLKATGIAAAILLGIGLSLGAELPGEQGAEVVGEVTFPSGPTIWPMWRDPR